MDNQNKKQITFMQLNKSLRVSGEPYVSCTVAGRVTHATGLQTIQSGATVANFIIPIQNQSGHIARMCGLEPSTDEFGTTWADVTVWGEQAKLFTRYLQKHPRSIITIIGSMRVRETFNAKGQPYNRVKITMKRFDHKTDLPILFPVQEEDMAG